MKKMYKGLVLIVIFLIIICPLIYGINNKITYAAPISIDETMSKEEIMKKYYELRDNCNNLEQKWADERIDIQKEKDSVDDSIFKIVTIGSSMFIVFSMGITVYVKKHIKDKVKELYENKINHVIENEINKKLSKEVAQKVGVEVESVKKMVDDCKKEEKLMKEKNILVISENSGKQKEIKKLLKHFNKITDFRLGDKLYDLSKYDVILFNNIDGTAKKDELNEIIKNNSNMNAVYFYFNKARKRFDSKKPDNTNFANSNSTFVGNLIDLMKYQDDILKNKSC